MSHHHHPLHLLMKSAQILDMIRVKCANITNLCFAETYDGTISLWSCLLQDEFMVVVHGSWLLAHTDILSDDVWFMIQTDLFFMILTAERTLMMTSVMKHVSHRPVLYSCLSSNKSSFICSVFISQTFSEVAPVTHARRHDGRFFSALTWR